MTGRHVISLDHPATHFHDGFPIGNGSLGAMMLGRPGHERIPLNLDTLWSGGPVAPEPAPPGGTLEAVRAALAAGDHRAAHERAFALQGRRYSESFQPLGELGWHYADATVAGDGYRRTLDLAEGTATTAHGPHTCDAFVSHPDRVLVLTVQGPPGWRPVEGVTFSSPHPTSRTPLPPEVAGLTGFVAGGRVPAHVRPVWAGGPDAVQYDTDPPDADGLVDAGMGFAVAVGQRRLGDGRWQVLVAAVDGYRGWARRPTGGTAPLVERAVATLLAASEHDEVDLRARHRRDHRRLFDACDLHLEPGAEAEVPTSVVEAFFDLGRYLTIASSRPGTQPANLQGIWNDRVRPAWSSNWTTNINLPMNYWGAEAVGLAECVEPLLDLVDDLVVTGAEVARTFYDADGSCAHHNVDLWRLTAAAPGEPQWAAWPSALTWLVSAWWDRWCYSGRDAALLPHLVGVLGAAARFVCSMLVPYSPDDPRLVVSPSTSPEHRFRTRRWGALCAVVAGSAMDQTLAAEVFTRLLALGDAVDPDLRERVAAALGRLRPPQVAADGVLVEWDVERIDEEPGHRHVSHLYGLYPGDLVDPLGDPLLEPCRAALQRRLDHGGGGTGWSQAWVLCLAARLGDAALVEHSLDILATRLTSESLLDLHPYRGMPGDVQFQIDGNFGAVAGIIEVFVRSRPGRVDLFNAVPPAWRAGRLRGVHVRGGHRIDLAWTDGRPTTVDVHGGSTERLTLGLAGSEVVLDLAPGSHHRWDGVRPR